jgi:hypothetical protein
MIARIDLIGVSVPPLRPDKKLLGNLNISGEVRIIHTSNIISFPSSRVNPNSP